MVQEGADPVKPGTPGPAGVLGVGCARSPGRGSRQGSNVMALHGVAGVSLMQCGKVVFWEVR